MCIACFEVYVYVDCIPGILLYDVRSSGSSAVEVAFKVAVLCGSSAERLE